MVKRYEKIIHLVYWVWFIFSPLLYWYLKFEPVEFRKLLNPLNISQLSIGAATFYFQYFFAMPMLFKSKKPIGAVLLWSFVSLLLYILLRYFVEELFYPRFLGFRNYGVGTTFTYYVFDNIYYGGKYIVASSLIWLVVYNAKIIEQRNELQKQQAEGEINFLRAQINPHFLFNTINNIYSLVYHQSEKALPAIQKLGELMRYMTTELAKEKVELEKEIDYLKSIIDLNALRYPGGAVRINVTGNTKNKVIAPFILLPFVENAFKHGEPDDVDQPIDINLSVENSILKYSCRNKINGTNKNVDGTGTGLSNLRRRLDLLYPNSYTILTASDGAVYNAELQINL